MASARLKTHVEIGQACAAQAHLCSTRGLPHFASESGVCWSCHGQIYEALDGKSYVTGCPFCHRSYCD